MTIFVSLVAPALPFRAKVTVISSSLFRTLAIAFSISCFLAAGTARGQDTPVLNLTPLLLVRLDGGLPANNLAKILIALSDEKVALRTMSMPLSPGARTCDLLTQAKFPPPCGDLLPYIGRLNPGVNLNTLSGATALTLPDVKIDVSPGERIFTRTSDTEQVLNSLVKNWSALNAKITENRSTEVGIQYERYDVQLFPEGPDEVIRAARIAVNLKLKNSAVAVKGLPTGSTKLFSNPDEDAKNDCESSNLFERLKAIRKYVNWFDRDTEAEKPHVAPISKVRIQIMDTPISMAMPNLNKAFNAIAQLKCTWAYDKDKHHGNHLASIIASQNNGTGFFGIEPGAQLESFNIRDPAVDSGSVADYLEISKRKSPLSIYLFATGIAVQHLVDPGPNWQTQQFRDKSTRASNLIFQTVSSMRPLLVVAAGQRETNSQALELSALTNLFPQNLGDFPNVIVVTACSKCSRGSAQLMNGAFYSEGAAKFVHVAAPGGTPIPGWTSESSMGAAAGTSQAAAYVAGVAAGMLSRYSDVYREPGALKYRLQMCSYPLPAATADRVQNPEPNRLSAGVVDPGVCLLDPTKTWVKKNGSWTSVAFKGWTDQTSFFRNRTRRVSVLNEDVLRVIRTNEDVIQNTQLALYVNRKDGPNAEYEVERGLGQVMLMRAGSHSTQAGLTLCDNTTLPLTQLEDVIIASQPASCSLNAE